MKSGQSLNQAKAKFRGSSLIFESAGEGSAVSCAMSKASPQMKILSDAYLKAPALVPRGR